MQASGDQRAARLKNVRTLIDEYPKEWKKLRTKLCGKDGFEFHGDSLKRPPAGIAKDHALLEDLKRKDFVAVQNLKIATTYETDFNKHTARLFKAGAPLVKFICDADDLPF